jgi:alanine dehydrogenase
MSEVAGRMSVQIAAHFLERENGGAGKLLAGVPGVPPSEVVIVGGGVVGANAAQIALGMGAHTAVLDRNLERLRYLDQVLHGHLTTLAANPLHTAEAVSRADVVVGAVLVPGAKAPRVVTKEMVAAMRPGSVIVDVAIDQGGCVETARPTTHSQPTFVTCGVVHYCVTNIPGAVPHTSTLALTNATLPYVLQLANRGLAGAVAADPALARGVNVHQGRVTHQPVAEALGLDHHPLSGVMKIRGGPVIV